MFLKYDKFRQGICEWNLCGWDERNNNKEDIVGGVEFARFGKMWVSEICAVLMIKLKKKIEL